MSHVAILDMILSKKGITKALIRLPGCPGWSAPVLLANHRRQVFSRRGPYENCHIIYLSYVYFFSDKLTLSLFIYFILPIIYLHLSYGVTAGSEIKPCKKINKPLVVYRFSRNVMTSITMLST